MNTDLSWPISKLDPEGVDGPLFLKMYTVRGRRKRNVGSEETRRSGCRYGTYERFGFSEGWPWPWAGAAKAPWYSAYRRFYRGFRK